MDVAAPEGAWLRVWSASHRSSFFSPARVLRVLLALTALVLLVSCSSGSGSRPVSAPAPSLSSWIAAVTGAPPELSLFIRPSAVRADPYWGPMFSRLAAERDRRGDFISHGYALQLANARQLDVHVSIRDPIRHADKRSKRTDPRVIGLIAVFHGLPPTDPLALRSGGGLPLYAPPFRLPSGVLMYWPDRNYLAEFEYAPTLFVTPDGTCILVDPLSATRARDVLAMNAAPPPPMEAAPGMLAGGAGSVTSLRFMDARRSDPGAILQGATLAGLGVRGGSNGSVEGFVDYTTSDDAARAYSAFMQSCAQKPESCELEPGMFKDARAERDDRRILVTLAFSDAMLRSIQSWTP
jgi:hypothetical protein